MNEQIPNTNTWSQHEVRILSYAGMRVT